MSTPRKARQRKRLRCVDTVVATIDAALARQGITAKVVEHWKENMPREDQMRPKDKYTMFDRKEKKYRKGIHSTWEFDTRVTKTVGLTRRLQSSPNGRGSVKESTRQVSRRTLSQEQYAGHGSFSLVRVRSIVLGREQLNCTLRIRGVLPIDGCIYRSLKEGFFLRAAPPPTLAIESQRYVQYG